MVGRALIVVEQGSEWNVIAGNGVGHLLAASVGVRGPEIGADQTCLVERVHRQPVRIGHPAQSHHGGDREENGRDADIEQRERDAVVVHPREEHRLAPAADDRERDEAPRAEVDAGQAPTAQLRDGEDELHHGSGDHAVRERLRHVGLARHDDDDLSTRVGEEQHQHAQHDVGRDQEPHPGRAALRLGAVLDPARRRRLIRGPDRAHDRRDHGAPAAGLSDRRPDTARSRIEEEPDDLVAEARNRQTQGQEHRGQEQAAVPLSQGRPMRIVRDTPVHARRGHQLHDMGRGDEPDRDHGQSGHGEPRGSGRSPSDHIGEVSGEAEQNE